jgi:predicted ATP-dependent serine protease
MKTKTKTEIKAAKSFNYACRQASNCRHDKYQGSCFACSLFQTCDIQKRIETARKKM